MGKKVFRIAALLLVIVMLAGCADMSSENDAAIQNKVEILVDALLTNDPDTGYHVVHSEISREEFDAAFEQMRAMLPATAEEYQLKRIQYHYQMKNGISAHQAGYELIIGQETFVVTAELVEGYDGLMSVYVTPAEYTALNHSGTIGHMAGANAVQWVVLVLGALAWMFVIWMVVDWCRRKMRKKILVLLLIIFGQFLLGLTMGGGSLNLRFNIGIYLQLSSLIHFGDGSWQLSLLIPVGAIVYCCLRKRLTIQPEESVSIPEGDRDN